MSKNHLTNVAETGNHGSVESYSVGFALSILFTAIPYYLVVQEKLTGTILLLTILAFAALQAIVQVVFFLHIGRGPKPRWNIFFFVTTIVFTAFVVGGSIVIINSLQYNMRPSEKIKKNVNNEGIYQINGTLTGACRQTKASHIVTIKDSKVSPEITIANKCDTLTFVNEDKSKVEIAFGEHEDHDSYAGEIDLPVTSSRPKTITLSEAGSFKFHNHFNEETAGRFIVDQ